MPIQIKTNNGYMSLDFWILSNVIQLLTMDFCNKFVSGDPRYRSGAAVGHDGQKQQLLFDPTGRQYDQMTQAARSSTANIAEGYSRHQTSIESEMKLMDVARASLEELKGDYFIFLLKAHQFPFEHSSREYIAIYAVDVKARNYNDDWDVESAKLIDHYVAQFQPWTKDSVTYARLIYILCSRCAKMIEWFIARRLEQFKQQGGFAENLTHARVDTMKAQAVKKGDPACPICGKPMLKRIVKRGTNQGKAFWGCSDYPKCNGTRKID